MTKNEEITNPYSDRRYELTTPDGEHVVLEPGETYKPKKTKSKEREQ